MAGFIIVNLLGFKFYRGRMDNAQVQLNQARTALMGAEVASRNRDSVTDAMDWLEKNLPRPADYQNVQSSLQSLAETEATSAGLSIRAQKLLDPDQDSVHFHRVQIQLTFTGTEQGLYRWVTTMNAPDKIRSVTRLQLAPNKEDDSKIDCTANVEQWFTPASSAASES